MVVAELRYVLPHPLVIRLSLSALDISMVSVRIAPPLAHVPLRIEVRQALPMMMMQGGLIASQQPGAVVHIAKLRLCRVLLGSCR